MKKKTQHEDPAAAASDFIRLRRPKPRVFSYHYSNEASQGALICETRGFPAGYHEDTENYHSAYSDRLAGWDRERYQEACELVGSGEQGWSSVLPALKEDSLKTFAQLILNLKAWPKHVRVVHYFNVSNGYSCPTIEAICDKEEEKNPRTKTQRVAMEMVDDFFDEEEGDGDIYDL